MNPKVHPLLSDLIMKALAKDPAQRYQSGKQLLDDLEKCKEVRPAARQEAGVAKKRLRSGQDEGGGASEVRDAGCGTDADPKERRRRRSRSRQPESQAWQNQFRSWLLRKQPQPPRE